MISRASMGKQLTGDRMPMTKKGQKIMRSMKEQYGPKKGEQVFYASRNKGSISGVERARSGGFVSTGTDAGDLAVLRSAKNIDDGPSGMKKGGAVKKESRVNEAGNYTKPAMRKRLFDKIKAGGKGGKPGQWSARKAQMLAREYKSQGGGYKD